MSLEFLLESSPRKFARERLHVRDALPLGWPRPARGRIHGPSAAQVLQPRDDRPFAIAIKHGGAHPRGCGERGRRRYDPVWFTVAIEIEGAALQRGKDRRPLRECGERPRYHDEVSKPSE